jgi:hypothetical protein
VKIDEAMIERIVGDVLKQLGAPSGDARADATFGRVPAGRTPSVPDSAVLSDRVITADLLAERVNGAAVVTVGLNSLVTPAAHDFLRARGLTLRRAQDKPNSNHEPMAPLPPLLIVVRSTPAVDRLWQDLQATWKRELLGCPDHAAKLAISAITRGEASPVVILAEQTHRAACLANRSDKVQAVAIQEAGHVRSARHQLRVNAWSVDPTRLSWIELRNIIRAIEQP